MKKIVFLASGNGGNLKYIYHSIVFFQNRFAIVSVIADRECGAIEFAKNKKLDYHLVKYSKQDPFELNELLIKIKPDIVVTNIYKILDISTLQIAPSIFINLHYSLLPSFKGLIGMITVDKARDLNVKFIGVTSHFVNEELDGGKIINQSTFTPQWFDQDIRLIYDTVFQSGAIILLSTILNQCDLITISEEKTMSMLINDNTVYFSESLPLNKSTHSAICQSIS